MSSVWLLSRLLRSRKMAKLYYNLIKAGSWTLEKVPGLWKAKVEELLAADNEGGFKSMETV